MKQEDVALHCQCGTAVEVSVAELVKFFMGEHVGRAIYLFGYLELAERALAHQLLVDGLHDKRPQFLEIPIYRILAPFPWHAALVCGCENFREFLEQLEFMLDVVI